MNYLNHPLDFLWRDGTSPTLFPQEVHNVCREFVAGLDGEEGRRREEKMAVSNEQRLTNYRGRVKSDRSRARGATIYGAFIVKTTQTTTQTQVASAVRVHCSTRSAIRLQTEANKPNAEAIAIMAFYCGAHQPPIFCRRAKLEAEILKFVRQLRAQYHYYDGRQGVDDGNAE